MRHWALEWNCVTVHSSAASFNPSYVDLSSYKKTLKRPELPAFFIYVVEERVIRLPVIR